MYGVIPSLPLLPGPLWPVVVSVQVLNLGEIDLFEIMFTMIFNYIDILALKILKLQPNVYLPNPSIMSPKLIFLKNWFESSFLLQGLLPKKFNLPYYLSIDEGRWKQMDSCLSPGHLYKVKCKQIHLGFELLSLCPFHMITITLQRLPWKKGKWDEYIKLWGDKQLPAWGKWIANGICLCTRGDLYCWLLSINLPAFSTL